MLWIWRNERNKHNVCSPSPNTQPSILVFHSWILHSPWLAARSLHWWVRAGHLVAVRGLSRLTTTKQPPLQSGFAESTMCFCVCVCSCVHPAVFECVCKYSREKIRNSPASYMQRVCSKSPLQKHNLWGSSGSPEGRQAKTQAVWGIYPAGENSWQAASNAILAPFPGTHCSHRCWAQVGDRRGNLAGR